MLEYVTEMTLLEQLALRPEINAPLINVIERNCHEKLKTEGSSVCIRDRLSGTYMFSAGEWGEVETLLEELRDDIDTFLVCDSSFRNNIRTKFPTAMISEYDSYSMKKEDYKPYCRMEEGFTVESLDESWVDFILEHYHDNEFGNRRYIRNRILKGPGLGITKDGDKAAFILQHKDGESGPLVVDRQYRGMHLGSELLRRFNGLLLKRNSILFGFVNPLNQASAGMMIKSGYKKADKSVLWVYRMKNGSIYLP